jgi:hypothetical protein
MGITIQEAQSANDSVRNREDPLSKFTGNTKVGAAPCQSSSDTPKEAGSMVGTSACTLHSTATKT